MKYAIQFIGFGQNPDLSTSWEYYTGVQYSVNHESYATSDRNINQAKLYSGKKRAENAVNSMYGKFVNVADARIVPVEKVDK